jgi:hypothetical protein
MLNTILLHCTNCIIIRTLRVARLTPATEAHYALCGEVHRRHSRYDISSDSYTLATTVRGPEAYLFRLITII